jgi:hypothetical protein
MNAPLPNDLRIGEGFAFFRWHCLRWPVVRDCQGLADEPGTECRDSWPRLQANRPALDVPKEG